MINETVTNKHYLPEAAIEAFLDASQRRILCWVVQESDPATSGILQSARL